MNNEDPTPEICAALLLSEIAAVETYTQALETFEHTYFGDTLERIRANHEENAIGLLALVQDAGVEPHGEVGKWGDFEHTPGVPPLIDECPDLKNLQAGEDFGISQYEAALAHPDVSIEAKDLIERALLPPLSEHLIELQRRKDSVT